jgi:hypothetical protein
MIREERQMKKFSLAMFAIAVALVFTQAVSAQTYDFTYTDTVNGVSATGWLFVTGGTATAGVADFNSQALSLLPDASAPGVVTSPSGWFNYDDQVSYPSSGPGTYLDTFGLVFVGSNPDELNIWENGLGVATDSFYTETGGSLVIQTNNGTFTLTPSVVPEYGSLSMLILCAFGLAGAFFFKGRKSGLFMNR